MNKDKFRKLQQDIIDNELLTMSPREIMDILETMNKEEANEFLGRLGHLRARAIYEKEKGNVSNNL